VTPFDAVIASPCTAVCRCSLLWPLNGTRGHRGPAGPRRRLSLAADGEAAPLAFIVAGRLSALLSNHADQRVLDPRPAARASTVQGHVLIEVEREADLGEEVVARRVVEAVDGTI